MSFSAVQGHDSGSCETWETRQSLDQTMANEHTAFLTVTNDYNADKLVLGDQADDKLKDLIGSVKSTSEKENLIRMLR